MSSSSIGDGDYYQQQNQSSQTAITAFLAKLWALVNDSTCDDLIAWDPSGNSFHVYDQSRFAREILPRYFKHNNFASFIRQLNMYGFRKISTIEHGSLKNERDDIEFAHQSFIRGHDTLLELIKRRAPDNQQKVTVPSTKPDLSSMSTSTSPISTSAAMISTNYDDTKLPRSVELTHLLEDVRTLQSKQTSLTDKLFHMEDENQALWREVGALKQKHAKQQQIVSKLMEFLLHFLTNSTQTHRPSVEQPPNNQSHPQNQTSHHHNIINQQIPTNSLKRKPAALMLGEEPKKRTTTQQQQQQQQQHLLSQPLHFGRPHGIIINELTDNDTSNWLHTTDTSPLVDLVPSPPPSISSSTIQQHLDDNYSMKPQTTYEWPVSSDELRNFPSQTKTLGNEANSYMPDFFLNSEHTNGTKSNLGPIDEANLSGINTSLSEAIPLLKEEEIDFSNQFQQQQASKSSSTINVQESAPFSLDDVTGDVHHIQTSLDNIRELMFDNLPDGTTIEDLFCDDHALLSPLLTTNILTDNTQQSKVENQYLYPNSTGGCKQLILHQSENPVKTSHIDMSNQLLEQLIHETAKIEEQQQTINRLERDKIDLEGKIFKLEQQQPPPSSRK